MHACMYVCLFVCLLSYEFEALDAMESCSPYEAYMSSI